MLKELSKTEWNELFTNGSFPVFFNPNYLDTVSLAFQVNIVYYSYTEKQDLFFLAAVFIKDNKVIIPDDFTYNPYFLNPTLSERKQIAIQNQFIVLLKSRFKSVGIKFNVDILDVRPYKWAGFNVDVRYTYIKNTSEPSHYSIEKNLKRVSKTDIEVRVNAPNTVAIDLNVDFLKTLGYTLIQKNCYSNFLHLLSKNNLLLNFEVYKSQNQIGSSLVLLDIKNFKAFTLISNPISHTFKYAHTLLYQTRINWLKENNYNEVDFCGANVESISNFKSFFNPTLKPYYVVRYKKSNFSFLLNIKEFAKKTYKIIFK